MRPLPRQDALLRRMLPKQLLGHKNVRTTMVYAHVLNRGSQGVRGPLDSLYGAIYSISILLLAQT